MVILDGVLGEYHHDSAIEDTDQVEVVDAGAKSQDVGLLGDEGPD